MKRGVRAFCSRGIELVVLAVILLGCGLAKANAQAAQPQAGAAMPSPAVTATVEVAGGTIDVLYNSPQMRGRKVMGELVPWNQVWRTGANPATTLITSVPLKFGDLLVPAGTHTIYTLPNPDQWLLIINNQTGQWGLTYTQSMDLGRTPMKKKSLSAPQEGMSFSFENTTPTSAEMHVKWETTDVYVPVTKP